MLRPRRISASHRDAFLERYEGLHSWAVQMTGGDRALAEDLLHDLFILFTLSQPDLHRIRNLDNYLYASLRNLHISQLRSATRGRFEQLSVVEYESARLSLHSISHGRDSIQVQDELRRVCRYACARKETANAASVLILRFFHGYYSSEIAKIIRSSRRAVDDRLRAARLEAKAHLEDSNGLASINAPAKSIRSEIFPARFARTSGDFLFELQQTIFSSRQGECLTREQIECLYQSNQRTMERTQLAHIVSCDVCLDRVNTLLGLPLLAERYPTDTMDKDNKKGRGPTDGDDKGGAVRRIREWEREAREAFEHKPQELCVSVNGHLLGSQLIGAELSELALNVAVDERISFCEVFSEQGIRLLMMNVDELPPNGPGELHQHMELSEGRSLESSLLFSNPFPTLHVTYRDPTLAEVQSQMSEVEENCLSPSATKTSDTLPAGQSQSKNWWASLKNYIPDSRQRTLGLRFLLRPGTVTALFALILWAGLLFQYWRVHTPPLTAAVLLQKASLAEATEAARTDQALHRTISLEERSSNGELIARRKIEVWHSAEKGVTARRLYDERGALVAGDWRRRDGVQTLYHHGSRPRLQLAPDKQRAGLPGFDDVWLLSPSAQDFSSVIGDAQRARIEERRDSYLITYEALSRNDASAGDSSTSPVVTPTLISATIVLTRADLHVINQQLVFAQGNERRQFHFIETSFERRAPHTVAPAVFDPEVELLGPGATTGKRVIESTTTKVAPPVAPILATAALEVEVLSLLNQAGADMGEQVNVTRTREGRLEVEALVETAERKAELLRALSAVKDNPALQIRISTVSEALRKQKASAQTSSSDGSVESAKIGNSLPAHVELSRYFAARGESGEQLERTIQRFATRITNLSYQTVQRGMALKRVAGRFSQEDLSTMDAETRLKWLALISGHARSLQQEIATLRKELGPIFSSPPSSAGEARDIRNDTELIQAADGLFVLCAEYDRAIHSAMAVSTDASGVLAIKGPGFWNTLQVSEKQAAKISQYRAGK